MKKFTSFLVLIAITISGFAQTVLFEENFDDAAAADRWTISEAGTSNVYDIAFDYVAAGLAAAPNGGGLGLKMEVNTSSGEGGSQILAFPTDGAFAGEYTLRFDAWLHWVDATSGTTEFALFGVDAATTDAPNITGDEFAFTGDNGSSRDIRVYEDGVEQQATDFPEYYADGQNINGFPYYEDSFDGVDASDEWLDILVQVSADSVFFSLNGVRWVQIPHTNAGGNIHVGYADFFSSVADGSIFMIVDNIRVYQGVVGVKDIQAENVSVYPNPANDILNIVSSGSSTFELINIAGKTVKTGNVNGSTTVNVSNLSKGIYFAKVTTQNGKVKISKIFIK